MTHKQLPNAIDAERSVIGSIIMDNSAIEQVTEILPSSAFYWSHHRKIYSAILELYKSNVKIDLITLSEKLKSQKNLEEIGGTIYLSDLTDQIATAAAIEHHAQIIVKKAILRELITTNVTIQEAAYEEPDDVEKLLDKAEHLIFEIRNRTTHRGFVPLSKIVPNTWDTLEHLHERKTDVVGVPSGFSKLDLMTTGFQDGDFILIAARPSVGKTALALNIARNVAIDHNISVGFFSLEMSKQQLSQRLLASEANINAQLMRSGRLSDLEWEKLSNKVEIINNAPIYIDDSASLGVLEIKARARRLKSEKDVGLIVVDYLQLMPGPNRSESRQQEITAISRSLKGLAKELQVPLIALSQLSRKVEERGGKKKPQLADLRDSGSLEQDADLVIFIYRPEYYKPDKEELRGLAEIIVGKQRNGPTGKIDMFFHANYAKFTESEGMLPYM